MASTARTLCGGGSLTDRSSCKRPACACESINQYIQSIQSKTFHVQIRGSGNPQSVYTKYIDALIHAKKETKYVLTIAVTCTILRYIKDFLRRKPSQTNYFPKNFFLQEIVRSYLFGFVLQPGNGLFRFPFRLLHLPYPQLCSRHELQSPSPPPSPETGHDGMNRDWFVGWLAD